MHDNLTGERPLPLQQEGPFYVDVRLVLNRDGHLITDWTLRNDLPEEIRPLAQRSLRGFRSLTGVISSAVASDAHPQDPSAIHDLLSDVAFPGSPEIRDAAWDAIVALVNGPGPHEY
jgi:hypothetical protein